MMLINRITSHQGWLFANIIRLTALYFLLFLATRLALLFIYPEDFQQLTYEQVAWSLFRGALHFDTAAIAMFLGPPVLLTLMPFRWPTTRWWHFMVGWYGFLVFALFLFIQIADGIYFGIVHRHVGQELGAALKTDPDAMISMALDGYGIWLLFYAGLFLLIFHFWRRGMRKLEIDPWYEKPDFSVRIPLIIVVLALMILCVRGSIVSKPIKPVYAFENVTIAEGQLALNGVFTGFHALNGEAGVEANFYEWDEAVENVQSMLLSGREKFVNPDYPLLREREPLIKRKSPPNIVVLLLESWDFDHLDATRESLGLKPFDVTPNFNTLAAEGVLFTRFYANGQRSIDAIAALLTGIPAIPGSGYLGEGVETNRFTWLGRLAREQGYSTYMLQGSRRASFYLDKIAPLAGYDSYLGAEDFSPSLHEDAKTPAWGGWDYDVLMQAHLQFAASKKPFAGFVFTVSTHVPFAVPGTQWQRFPEKNDETRFLNSLYYADWALGEFFANAKKAGYFKNTIFILTADHVAGFGRDSKIATQHHIPALIIAPGLKPGINDTPGSQTDILPTLIDLAGWNVRHAGVGTSLLEKDVLHGAFIRRGGIIGRIEDGNVLMHDLNKRVHFEGDEAAAKGIKKRLLSTMQVLDGILKRNRVTAELH